MNYPGAGHLVRGPSDLGTLRHVRNAAAPRGAALSFVALYAVALGGQYLLPYTIEQTASITIGRTSLLFVEVLLLGIFVVHRRVSNPFLFRWALASLTYAVMSGIALSRDLEVACFAAFDAYLPYILLALVPFSERYRGPLKLILTGLLVAIVAEVMLYATGVLAHPMAASSQFGDVARISTTVGSATATGAVLFMLGAWCADLWGFNWKGVVVAWVSALGVATTFSRGPMLMMVSTVASAGVAWVLAGRFVTARIGRLVAVSSAMMVSVAVAAWVGGVSGLNDAVAARLRDGIGDSGRVERYTEAWETFVKNPVFGVGTGEYFPRWRSMDSGFVPIGRTSPHNVYLLLLAENGVVGAALFTIGVAFLAYRVLRRWRERPAGLSVLAILVVGFTTEVLYVEAQFALLLAGVIAWFDRRATSEHAKAR